jgi:thioredoxin-like negative regulator of GroEL
VIQSLGQFVPVKINAEKEGVAVAKRYGVQGYPTLLFIDAAGAAVAKIGGYLPPAPFNEQLTRIGELRNLPQLEARVRANPGDVAAVAKLATLYAQAGKEQRAAQLLAQAEKADPKNGTGALAPAYNAVADRFQEKEQFDKAIPLFRKAVAAGRSPYDIAYARLSIAVCYMSQQKNREAIPELEATLAVPNVPADMKQQAQQFLDQLKGHSGN